MLDPYFTWNKRNRVNFIGTCEFVKEQFHMSPAKPQKAATKYPMNMKESHWQWKILIKDLPNYLLSH